MILLMGIKTSFTKNPTNPITTNPIAVLTATLVNSATQKKRSISESENSKRKFQIKDGIKKEEEMVLIRSILPFRSGLWHLLTRRTLSLANSLRGSTTESRASISKRRERGKKPQIQISTETRRKRRWTIRFYSRSSSNYFYRGKRSNVCWAAACGGHLWWASLVQI